MSFTLAQTLKRYLEERKRLNKTCPEFFCSLNRNMGYTYDGLRRLVKQMRKASGVNFTIHKLRHTFATRTMEDIYKDGSDPSASLPILATYMGHVNLDYTQTYLHPSIDLLEKAGEKFKTYSNSYRQGKS